MTDLDLAAMKRRAAEVHAQSVCSGFERTLARDVLTLIARVRELERERDDWCDAARSEAAALNEMTRQRR